MSPADTETTQPSLIKRSARSLRNTILGLGGAASVSSLAALDAVAKELTKAERRRRRRQREREEEREEEREQRRAERRRRDNDDDDDDGRMEVLRARQAALMDRSPGERRATARQSADDESTGETLAGGRTRRQQAESDDERSSDDSRVLEAPQVLDDISDTETDTDTGSETAEIRVGSGDTFASIDPETGTATAESNGVRAIAGPEGAFIEGSPSDTPSPASPSDDFDDDLGDGNDDGLDPSPDGGDNGGDLLS